MSLLLVIGNFGAGESVFVGLLKGLGSEQDVPAIPWDSYRGSVDDDILSSFRKAYTGMSPSSLPRHNLWAHA